jgi:hypothetical protein
MTTIPILTSRRRFAIFLFLVLFLTISSLSYIRSSNAKLIKALEAKSLNVVNDDKESSGIIEDESDEVSIARYSSALHREPPPGFIEWLRYARASGCQTDVAVHYSQIYKDYARFFKLGKIPRDTSFNLTILRKASIYEFNNGEFTSTGKHSNEETLKSIEHLIPTNKTFRIAINNWDEPISLPATDGYTEPYRNPADGVEHN